LNPKNELAEIYNFLGEEEFDHDFEEVKNTATDVDALYNYKYPHRGAGKITDMAVGSWKDFLPEDFAQNIIDRFPWFYENFRYYG